MVGHIAQRNTSLRIRFKHLGQQIQAEMRDRAANTRRKGPVLRVHLAQHRELIAPIERIAVGQHHVQADAQRPHVRLHRVVALFLEHFGRHVALGTAVRAGQHHIAVSVALTVAAQTEVGQFRIVHLVEQNVVQLQIAMSDAQFVQIDQSIDHGCEEQLLNTPLLCDEKEKRKFLTMCFGQRERESLDRESFGPKFAISSDD